MMMLSSTPACISRMTWASGLVGRMFGGNALDSIALSGGVGVGCACAGELNGEQTPAKHSTTVAVPNIHFLKNSIFIITLLSILDVREYNMVTMH
jgi:hypothetical protein